LLVSAAVVARNAHDYRRVDALLTAVPDADHTHDVRVIHGHAAMQLGRWQDADRRLAAAQDVAADDTQMVAATLIRSWNLFWMAVRADEALRVTSAARELLTDPAGRRVLAVNEAALLALSGHPAAGLAGLDDIDHGSAWFVAATAKTAGLAYVGRAEAAIAWGEQVLATGTVPVAQLNPMIVAFTDAGRLGEARRTADRLFDGAARTDAALTWTWAACFRGRLEWLAGDAAAARRWYAEALAQARVHGYLGSTFEARAGLAASAAALGDIAAAEVALAEMRKCPPLGHLAGEEDLGAAWLCAARGDLGQARTVLTAAAGRARAAGHVSSEMVLLTDIARLGGARDVAGRLAELGRSCEGAFAPARAHLAAALATGEPEQLLSAADELRAIGANLLAAELSSVAATAWQRVGQPRRATAATHQAGEYAALCPGVRTPLLATADASDAALSSREREIALLAAAGTSSKDIAGTLHLSVRTVDNHLQHAYTKLGVSGRHELAAAIGNVRSTVD
jgi:DNA-binding CsgD family transcriptional regulator